MTAVLIGNQPPQLRESLRPLLVVQICRRSDGRFLLTDARKNSRIAAQSPASRAVPQLPSAGSCLLLSMAPCATGAQKTFPASAGEGGRSRKRFLPASPTIGNAV